MRYDASATGGCVETLPQIITAPTALVTTATVTKPATCTTGAEITAISAGGTLAYSYELWDATNTESSSLGTSSSYPDVGNMVWYETHSKSLV